MIFSYELWIAYRYLRARREDGFISIVSWFSLIGISLGVATLIIVMSVMNGFREELLSRIIGLNGHASLYLNEDSKKINSNNIEKLLMEIEEVTDTIPIVESTIMITANNKSKGIITRGISIENFKSNHLLYSSISSSTFNNFIKPSVCLVASVSFPFRSNGSPTINFSTKF